MFGAAVLMTICTAAAAFCVRFLVALCGECKHSWIAYLLRLEPDENSCQVVEWDDVDPSVDEVA